MALVFRAIKVVNTLAMVAHPGRPQLQMTSTRRRKYDDYKAAKVVA